MNWQMDNAIEKAPNATDISRRFAAYLIDMAICGGAFVFLHFAYVTLLTNAEFDSLNSIRPLLCYGKPMYFLLFEQSKWSATLGKKMCGLQVRSSSGSQPQWHMILARVAIYSAVPWLSYFSQSLLQLTPHYCAIVRIALKCLLVIWIAPIFFTQNKTGVYELLSRTRVVRVDWNASAAETRGLHYPLTFN